MEDKTQHINVLKTEMDVLASRLDPHYTGHFHTAISVLKHRVSELLRGHRKVKVSTKKND